jgi:hypothetical protein
VAAWIDVTTLHNPATGTSPPATWGDGINNNFDIGTLRNVKAAQILTNESTSSSSYTDLATTGPSVTVDTGTTALVIISAQLVGAGGGFVSVAVSGATTIAASDDQMLFGANIGPVSALAIISGLNAGLNTFTLRYKSASGSMSFLRRRIAVIPLF